jgi:hypothetical protein
MKIGSRPRGFTIVETLIVLAVTGFLFIVAVVLISGKQERAELTTGSRDLESRFQTIINDVSNGFYPNTGTFSCHQVGGVPTITTPFGGGAEQGTNKDCIFLGKIVQFKVGGATPEVYHVYTVVGARVNSSGDPVSDLTEAKPRIITVTNSYDIQTLPFGISAQAVKYNGSTNIGAVAFLSDLGDSGAQGDSGQVDVYPILGTSLGQSLNAGTITGMQNQLSNAAAPVNPNGGVQVCMVGGSGNKSILYNIGTDGRKVTISTDIKNGGVC